MKDEAGLSRRELLAAGGLYGGGLWLALRAMWPGAARAETGPEAPAEPRTEAPAAPQTEAPAAPGRAALSAHEWETVEALTARIVPTDDEPGALEAGCVAFIDRALAGEEARALPLYRAGVAGVDAVARAAHDAPFAALPAGAQDAVLERVAAGGGPAWPAGAVTAPVFFETVRAHTLLGFLADPKYGGNRGHAGWRVTGYPGPRHRSGGYTPAQMLGTEKIRTVWGEKI